MGARAGSEGIGRRECGRGGCRGASSAVQRDGGEDERDDDNHASQDE